MINITLVFFQSFSALAQMHKEVIHAEENLADHFTYRFPVFEEAAVLLKSGGTIKYRMNLNMLLCSMLFINEKGDTMEVEEPDVIDSIRFKNSTFFLREGYCEVIAANGPFKLAVSRTATSQVVTLGAMGAPARNYSVQLMNSYRYNKFSLPTNLQVNQDIYIFDKTEYLLINETGEFIKASRNNFLKTFSSDKKNIEDFLKSNKTNFNTQHELEKLFHFCTHT